MRQVKTPRPFDIRIRPAQFYAPAAPGAPLPFFNQSLYQRLAAQRAAFLRSQPQTLLDPGINPQVANRIQIQYGIDDVKWRAAMQTIGGVSGALIGAKTGATQGAVIGGKIGSILPGKGTIIGGAIGTGVGAVAGAVTGAQVGAAAGGLLSPTGAIALGELMRNVVMDVRKDPIHGTASLALSTAAAALTAKYVPGSMIVKTMAAQAASQTALRGYVGISDLITGDNKTDQKASQSSFFTVAGTMQQLSGAQTIKAALASVTGDKEDFMDLLSRAYGWHDQGYTSIDFSRIRKNAEVNFGVMGNMIIDFAGEMLVDPMIWNRHLLGMAEADMMVRSATSIGELLFTESPGSPYMAFFEKVTGNQAKRIGNIMLEHMFETEENLRMVHKMAQSYSGKAFNMFRSDVVNNQVLRPIIQEIAETTGQAEVEVLHQLFDKIWNQVRQGLDPEIVGPAVTNHNLRKEVQSVYDHILQNPKIKNKGELLNQTLLNDLRKFKPEIGLKDWNLLKREYLILRRLDEMDRFMSRTAMTMFNPLMAAARYGNKQFDKALGGGLKGLFRRVAANPNSLWTIEEKQGREFLKLDKERLTTYREERKQIYDNYVEKQKTIMKQKREDSKEARRLGSLHLSELKSERKEKIYEDYFEQTDKIFKQREEEIKSLKQQREDFHVMYVDTLGLRSSYEYSDEELIKLWKEDIQNEEISEEIKDSLNQRVADYNRFQDFLKADDYIREQYLQTKSAADMFYQYDQTFEKLILHELITTDGEIKVPLSPIDIIKTFRKVPGVKFESLEKLFFGYDPKDPLDNLRILKEFPDSAREPIEKVYRTYLSNESTTSKPFTSLTHGEIRKILTTRKSLDTSYKNVLADFKEVMNEWALFLQNEKIDDQWLSNYSIALHPANLISERNLGRYRVLPHKLHYETLETFKQSYNDPDFELFKSIPTRDKTIAYSNEINKKSKIKEKITPDIKQQEWLLKNVFGLDIDKLEGDPKLLLPYFTRSRHIAPKKTDVPIDVTQEDIEKLSDLLITQDENRADGIMKLREAMGLRYEKAEDGTVIVTDNVDRELINEIHKLTVQMFEKERELEDAGERLDTGWRSWYLEDRVASEGLLNLVTKLLGRPAGNEEFETIIDFFRRDGETDRDRGLGVDSLGQPIRDWQTIYEVEEYMEDHIDYSKVDKEKQPPKKITFTSKKELYKYLNSRQVQARDYFYLQSNKNYIWQSYLTDNYHHRQELKQLSKALNGMFNTNEYTHDVHEFISGHVDLFQDDPLYQGVASRLKSVDLMLDRYEEIFLKIPKDSKDFHKIKAGIFQVLPMVYRDRWEIDPEDDTIIHHPDMQEIENLLDSQQFPIHEEAKKIILDHVQKEITEFKNYYFRGDYNWKQQRGHFSRFQGTEYAELTSSFMEDLQMIFKDIIDTLQEAQDEIKFNLAGELSDTGFTEDGHEVTHRTSIDDMETRLVRDLKNYRNFLNNHHTGMLQPFSNLRRINKYLQTRMVSENSYKTLVMDESNVHNLVSEGFNFVLRQPTDYKQHKWFKKAFTTAFLNEYEPVTDYTKEEIIATIQDARNQGASEEHLEKLKTNLKNYDEEIKVQGKSPKEIERLHARQQGQDQMALFMDQRFTPKQQMYYDAFVGAFGAEIQPNEISREFIRFVMAAREIAGNKYVAATPIQLAKYYYRKAENKGNFEDLVQIISSDRSTRAQAEAIIGNYLKNKQLPTNIKTDLDTLETGREESAERIEKATTALESKYKPDPLKEERNVIHKSIQKVDLEYLERYLSEKLNIEDVKLPEHLRQEFQRVSKEPTKTMRLESLAQFYDVDFDSEKAHSALYDAEKTGEIWIKMLNNMTTPAKFDASFNMLNERWVEDQQLELDQVMDIPKKWRDKKLSKLPYTVIDIETTGLHMKDEKIFQLAAVKIKDGKIIDKHLFEVNPEKEIPQWVTQLTQLKDPGHYKDSPKLEDIHKQLMKYIGEDIVIAHNASFDINFIREQFKQKGKSFNISGKIDTLNLTKLQHRHDIKDPKIYEEKRYNFANKVIAHLVNTTNLKDKLKTETKTEKESIENALVRIKRQGKGNVYYWHGGERHEIEIPKGKQNIDDLVEQLEEKLQTADSAEYEQQIYEQDEHYNELLSKRDNALDDLNDHFDTMYEEFYGDNQLAWEQFDKKYGKFDDKGSYQTAVKLTEIMEKEGPERFKQALVDFYETYSSLDEKEIKIRVDKIIGEHNKIVNETESDLQTIYNNIPSETWNRKKNRYDIKFNVRRPVLDEHGVVRYQKQQTIEQIGKDDPSITDMQKEISKYELMKVFRDTALLDEIKHVLIGWDQEKNDFNKQEWIKGTEPSIYEVAGEESKDEQEALWYPRISQDLAQEKVDNFFSVTMDELQTFFVDPNTQQVDTPAIYEFMRLNPQYKLVGVSEQDEDTKRVREQTNLMEDDEGNIVIKPGHKLTDEQFAREKAAYEAGEFTTGNPVAKEIRIFNPEEIQMLLENNDGASIGFMSVDDYKVVKKITQEKYRLPAPLDWYYRRMERAQKFDMLFRVGFHPRNLVDVVRKNLQGLRSVKDFGYFLDNTGKSVQLYTQWRGYQDEMLGIRKNLKLLEEEILPAIDKDVPDSQIRDMKVHDSLKKKFPNVETYQDVIQHWKTVIESRRTYIEQEMLNRPGDAIQQKKDKKTLTELNSLLEKFDTESTRDLLFDIHENYKELGAGAFLRQHHHKHYTVDELQKIIEGDTTSLDAKVYLNLSKKQKENITQEMLDQGIEEKIHLLDEVHRFQKTSATTDWYKYLLDEYEGKDEQGKIKWDRELIEHYVKNNPISRNYMNMGIHIEQIGRLSGYLQDKHLHGHTHDTAVARSLKRHFDYSDKSPAEMWMSLLFPFFSFPTRNALFWSEQFQDASKIRTYYNFMKAAWGSYDGDDEQESNDFIRHAQMTGYIPFGNTLWKMGDSRAGALSLFLDTHTEAYNRLNPFIRAPIQMLQKGTTFDTEMRNSLRPLIGLAGSTIGATLAGPIGGAALGPIASIIPNIVEAPRRQARGMGVLSSWMPSYFGHLGTYRRQPMTDKYRDIYKSLYTVRGKRRTQTGDAYYRVRSIMYDIQRRKYT